MYPSSLRIRASSRLSLEDGIVTSRCCALAALRKRVRKSEMGSVIDMATSSTSSCRGCIRCAPARAGRSGRCRTCGTRHGRDRNGDSGCSRGSCTWVSAAGGRAVKALPFAPLNRCCRLLAAVACERHPERLEQRERFLVAGRRRRNRDVEAADLIDLVVVGLGEDDLLPDTERVVAATVERARVQTAEVTN